jgi:Ca-activated chloride channel family protein
MSFLAPASLLLGLLAGPIIILYMLKLRRRELEVSSTLLWHMVLRDREANSPWQRLRRNLLLLIQLLLLAALVLALARPFWRVPTVATGTLVVLLDGSASMQATDAPGAATRFEAARAAIRQVIDGLGTNGSMTLILVGQQPQVLATASGDKAELHDVLSRAQPSQGEGDWPAATALASGAVRAGDATHSVIVVVSDGGLPPNLPPLPAEVRYIPVGSSADNLAIRALAVRASASGPQLFASVANYGAAVRPVIVSVSINGKLYSAQQLTVAPGGSSDMVLTGLPSEPAVYQARLTLPASAANANNNRVDALPLDDQAWAVYQPPSAGRVLVVSQGNVFLEQVFAALSVQMGFQPFRLKAGQPIPPDPFNLYVFDGPITGTLPAGDLLLINPSSNALFTVGGVFTSTTGARTTQNDALTQFVDWRSVHLLQAHQVQLPAWARVVVDSDGGPLLFAGEVDGRRVAVITFDLHDSDLPLQVSFPILMSNLLNYLAPANSFSAPDGLQPGQSIPIKLSGGETNLVIQDPSGARFALPAGQPAVSFADTRLLGVYTVLANQTVLGNFAVNLFDPFESNIRPQASIRLGRDDVTASTPQEQGTLEIWPWIAAAAFLLLLLEWWVYHRGMTVPKFRKTTVEF